MSLSFMGKSFSVPLIPKGTIVALLNFCIKTTPFLGSINFAALLLVPSGNIKILFPDFKVFTILYIASLSAVFGFIGIVFVISNPSLVRELSLSLTPAIKVIS